MLLRIDRNHRQQNIIVTKASTAKRNRRNAVPEIEQDRDRHVPVRDTAEAVVVIIDEKSQAGHHLQNERSKRIPTIK